MGAPRKSFTDIDSGTSGVVAEGLKELRSLDSFINCLVRRCMTDYDAQTAIELLYGFVANVGRRLAFNHSLLLVAPLCLRLSRTGS